MQIFYEPGTHDPSELQELVDEIMQELLEGGPALTEARNGGLELEELLGDAALAEDITVESGKSGFEPLTTVVIVTIVRPILLDLWRQILLPRIKRRWTTTAIGREVTPDGAPSEE